MSMTVEHLRRHLESLANVLREADGKKVADDLAAILDGLAPFREQALKSFADEVQIDAIVHLGAQAGVRYSIENPAAYVHSNLVGHCNMLELARDRQTRHMVYASSSSVYGGNKSLPFRVEDRVDHPLSLYAATKKAGELLSESYASLYRLPLTGLRFFTVYGARQRPDLAIHKFAKLISNGQPIPVFGDGTTRRDYTYIDDIIAGVRAAIDYDASKYEIINLGESRTVELRELISLLEKALGKKADIDRQPMQPGDVPQTFADIAKARRLLNYNPQTQIEDGINKFVEWFLGK